jgi:hypothetical protein
LDPKECEKFRTTVTEQQKSAAKIRKESIADKQTAQNYASIKRER